MRNSAIKVLMMAGSGDVLLGIAFSYANHVSVPIGLYFSVTTATTVGYGDITPHGFLAHLIAIAIQITIIPLFAAAFSLVTSELGAVHVRREADSLRRHILHIVKHHPDIPDYEEEK